MQKIIQDAKNNAMENQLYEQAVYIRDIELNIDDYIKNIMIKFEEKVDEASQDFNKKDAKLILRNIIENYQLNKPQ